MLQLPSEHAIVVTTIDPATGNNTTKQTGSVDMSKFLQAYFILLTGSCDNTVDFKLQGSSDNSNWTDLPNKAITQLNAQSNKQAVLNVQSGNMLPTYRYVRGFLTLGNGTTQTFAVVGLGMMPRFEPASDDKSTNLVQIVT
jgi:hypothetical protein